jgi:demethoxyubiquinone hydroxylase (CLK1/Coq7/Cat5 family)
MFAKFKTYASSPTVQKYFWLAAAYGAGAYGGPIAANAVQAHGPAIVNVIAKLFGG